MAQSDSTIPFFDRDKKRIIHDKKDLSRKGSVDEPIVDLVEYINGHDHYYTTSSCSGRIIVFSECIEEIKKKGCNWILTSHETITIQKLQFCLSKNNLTGTEGYVYLKFEAMVLHVACRDMSHAQHMLQSSVSSGFRNSGISIGNKGRIILAVRSTHSLQTPIAFNEFLLVTNEYLEHIVGIANHKMTENMQRITRFFETVKLQQQKMQYESVVTTDKKGKHVFNKDDTKCEQCTELIENDLDNGLESMVDLFDC